MSRSIQLASLLSPLAALLFAAPVPLGDINPPAGPVTSTMKPLTAVEPRIAIDSVNTPGTVSAVFAITAPGSYYLLGNVIGQPGRSGIRVTTPGAVTIDLMGFELVGGPASFDGVESSGGPVTVRNGTIREWGHSGLRLTGPSPIQLEDLKLIDNDDDGVLQSGIGTGAIVNSCIAEDNGMSGFTLGGSAVISDCYARQNGSAGIQVLVEGASVQRCVTRSNGGVGISASGSIAECVSESNGSHGINVVGSIVAGFPSIVSDCTAGFNAGDGIKAQTSASIVRNNCHNNGQSGSGAGIHTVGILSNRSRIEANTVCGNDTGIDIDGASTLVIGNFASGNTANYSIAAGNIAGTIVTTAAAMNASANSNVNVSF